MSDLPAASARVQAAAEALRLSIAIRIMPDSTRTAMEAAAACGCAVDQIVKSLIFKGETSGRPLLFLVSGANRLDEQKAAALVGEPLSRPNAAFVRDVTGYAIGGIPPFGHETKMPVLMDRHLMDFETIWAAAGTPYAVFPVAPKALGDAVEATVAELA